MLSPYHSAIATATVASATMSPDDLAQIIQHMHRRQQLDEWSQRTYLHVLDSADQMPTFMLNPVVFCRLFLFCGNDEWLALGGLSYDIGRHVFRLRYVYFELAWLLEIGSSDDEDLTG